MIRGRFVMRGGALVRVEDAGPLHPPGAPSDLACPMLVRDQMDPTPCMADGLIYTSKRAMSATHRRMGMVELGNERPAPKQRSRPSRREIKDTLERAKARFDRGERSARVASQA